MSLAYYMLMLIPAALAVRSTHRMAYAPYIPKHKG